MRRDAADISFPAAKSNLAACEGTFDETGHHPFVDGGCSAVCREQCAQHHGEAYPCGVGNGDPYTCSPERQAEEMAVKTMNRLLSDSASAAEELIQLR